MSVSKKRRRQVCLFGLSADPPTGEGGHVGIVRALASLPEFDEVRVLPVYRHTFSEKRDRLAPFQNRVAMCRLAFGGIPKVQVTEDERLSFERKAKGLTHTQLLELRVGTADLLDMLLESEHEDTDFSFALGADTFLDLTNWKWRNSKDVLRLLEGRFVVFSRQDTCDKTLQERIDAINRDEKGQVRFLSVPTLTGVSSTMVRSCTDEQELREMVVPKVLDYIKGHKMYGFSKES